MSEFALLKVHPFSKNFVDRKTKEQGEKQATEVWKKLKKTSIENLSALFKPNNNVMQLHY
jgi:hypothetical protein